MKLTQTDTSFDGNKKYFLKVYLFLLLTDAKGHYLLPPLKSDQCYNCVRFMLKINRVVLKLSDDCKKGNTSHIEQAVCFYDTSAV